MDRTHEATTAQDLSRGRAFRRVGATVAVACAVTGSIVGLGAIGALASPGTPPTAAVAPAGTVTEAVDVPPKATWTDADLAAFTASPYAGDALNLAVAWGLDTETAAGKAGAAITAGRPLPFEVGEASTASYTDDQERWAYFLGGTSYGEALGLAALWGSPDVYTAKAEIGALLLAHEPVPAAPTTYTEEQQAAAFRFSGYTDADAATLAALWQTDARSATVRAGSELLSGGQLPL